LKIEQVFGSAPRTGGQYWCQRGKNMEDDFRQLFEEKTSKKVVIIDGPTGAGKTFLAYRTLYQSKTTYNYRVSYVFYRYSAKIYWPKWRLVC
jgi:polynucleotide 5'-kinase involved in rRNA processing